MKAKSIRSEVGLGLSVIHGFELAREEVRGAAPDTLFQAGSVSKPVAALAALRIVEAGVLDLDADVNEALLAWKVPGAVRVTLRHLLSHTAGLGVEFFPGYPAGAPLPSLEQILDGIPPATTGRVRVEAEPGRGFRYSGGGYVVLQLLLADATGIPFPELAAELVLEPLGMVHSTFEQSAGRGCRIYPETAAAGLWTTATDLGRLVVAIQRALAGLGGPVSREVAELMTAPTVVLPPEGEWLILRTLGIEPPDRFGLGLFLGRNRFSHLGGSAGFFCAVIGSLTDGTGAAVMTSSDPSPEFFEILLAVADAQGWRDFRSEAV